MDAQKKWCFCRSCWHLRREICLSRGKPFIYFFFLCPILLHFVSLSLYFSLAQAQNWFYHLTWTINYYPVCGLPLSQSGLETNYNHLMVTLNELFRFSRVLHHWSYFAMCKALPKSWKIVALHILMKFHFTLFIYLFHSKTSICLTTNWCK